jgi:hypothetical protein
MSLSILTTYDIPNDMDEMIALRKAINSRISQSRPTNPNIKTADMPAYKREYYNMHKDTILPKMREYQRERRKTMDWTEKVLCKCGATINKCGMSLHKRTKKHKLFLESFNN